jgi:hypothetical protein
MMTVSLPVSDYLSDSRCLVAVFGHAHARSEAAGLGRRADPGSCRYGASLAQAAGLAPTLPARTMDEAMPGSGGLRVQFALRRHSSLVKRGAASPTTATKSATTRASHCSRDNGPRPMVAELEGLTTRTLAGAGRPHRVRRVDRLQASARTTAGMLHRDVLPPRPDSEHGRREPAAL